MAKIVFTEEETRLMMGLLPFDINATIDFTPEIFKTKYESGDLAGKYMVREELWPVFKIRLFTKQERDVVRRIVADISMDPKKVEHGSVTEWARKITMGWKNFIDLSSGEEVAYKADPSGGCDKDLFGMLPETNISNILYRAVHASGLVNGERMGLGY